MSRRRRRLPAEIRFSFSFQLGSIHSFMQTGSQLPAAEDP